MAMKNIVTPKKEEPSPTSNMISELEYSTMSKAGGGKKSCYESSYKKRDPNNPNFLLDDNGDNARHSRG